MPKVIGIENFLPQKEPTTTITTATTPDESQEHDSEKLIPSERIFNPDGSEQKGVAQ
jgi:hypothetical protein